MAGQHLGRDQERAEPGDKLQDGPRHPLLAPELSFLNELMHNLTK